MATLNQEESLRNLALFINMALKKAYGEEMGFMLVSCPFGQGDKVSDYIGNMERGSGIEMLRTTADRLEKNQTIPASEGEA